MGAGSAYRSFVVGAPRSAVKPEQAPGTASAASNTAAVSDTAVRAEQAETRMLAALGAGPALGAPNRAAADPSPPTVTLDANASARQVVAGGSASFDLTATPSGGFVGELDLAASGLPAGRPRRSPLTRGGRGPQSLTIATTGGQRRASTRSR